MSFADYEDLKDRVEQLEYALPSVSEVEKWNRTAWFIEQLLMENSALRAALENAKIPIPETAQERADWMQEQYRKLHDDRGNRRA